MPASSDAFFLEFFVLIFVYQMLLLRIPFSRLDFFYPDNFLIQKIVDYTHTDNVECIKWKHL